MAAPGGSSGTSRRLVQYVVVRADLVRTLAWPLGAVITQACHAATAAIHLHYSDPDTQEYLAELDCMHKVVLEAPDEASLSSLSDVLSREGVAHKLWVEQPENMPTCLALKPYPKENVHHLLRKFKLLKKSSPPLDPLSIDSSHSIITRHWFSAHLSTLLSRAGLPPQLFSPHSFCIGAATSAAGASINHSLIKTMGRWSSSAIDSYVHPSPSDIAAAHSKIVSMPGVGATCPPGPPEVFP
ncbi:UNVERIFIED_CONTAM: hypothetical protein FKN15_076181 [Acipenser sinensis]